MEEIKSVIVSKLVIVAVATAFVWIVSFLFAMVDKCLNRTEPFNAFKLFVKFFPRLIGWWVAIIMFPPLEWKGSSVGFVICWTVSVVIGWLIGELLISLTSQIKGKGMDQDED